MRIESNLLGVTKNGNCTNFIYNDGTKVRICKEDKIKLDYAENIDVKITNKCDMNCPYCHENSNKDGKHGNTEKILRFIDSLHPYQEIALGGGNILEHPDLIRILRQLKINKIITNITLNQVHFSMYYKLIQELVNVNIVYGVGISLTNYSDDLINKVKSVDNTVIHLINGVVTEDIINNLANKDLKVLILGYKNFRRGNDYYQHSDLNPNFNYLKNNIKQLIKSQAFKTVSFDNLALEQLDIKSMFPDEWNLYYMGNDGSSSYYVDFVDEKFARNSTVDENKRYKLLDTTDEMFKIIKEESEAIT
jgi:organic radical activating enzyme